MQDAGDFAVSVHDDLPLEAARSVDAGLGEFNASAAPLHEVRPLACFVRDAGGTVVGGAVGRTWGLCCELQQLWVAPQLRRKGIGARLVQAFEARARERGCRRFYLETFSFQARPLYEKLGYEVFATLDDFPPGHQKFFLRKKLK